MFGFDLTSLKYLVASFAATYCSGLTHPLDLIKTRLQSKRFKYLRSWWKSIFWELSAPLSIYTRRIQIDLSDLGSSWSLQRILHLVNLSGERNFFILLDVLQLKHSYEVRKNIYEKRGLQKMDSVTLASIEASVLATVVTQPVWVVKTRMLLNVNKGVTEF